MTDYLAIVLGGLAAASRGEGAGQSAGMLAPDVVREGVRPDVRCDGRGEVMRIIGRQVQRRAAGGRCRRRGCGRPGPGDRAARADCNGTPGGRRPGTSITSSGYATGK